MEHLQGVGLIGMYAVAMNQHLSNSTRIPSAS